MNHLDYAPQTNRSQPNYQESHSALRTITRQGYRLWSPLIYRYKFILFILQALIFSTRRARWLRPFTVDDSAYPQFANPISCFSTIFTETIAKKPKIFLFVVQFQGRRPYRKLLYEKYKRPPKAKRLPTTDRAEQPIRFRENCPTPPKTAAFPLFPPRTTVHIAREEAAHYN